MKTKLMMVLMAFVMTGGLHVSAQEKKDRPDRPRMTPEEMMQRESKRMARALLLDDAAAAKFTAVYENYLKEINDCRQERRQALGAGRQAATGEARAFPTDEELEKQALDGFAHKRKMLDIKEKYYKEFRKFLSPRQVQKIFEGNDWRRHRHHRRGEGCHGYDGRHPGHPCFSSCPAEENCRWR